MIRKSIWLTTAATILSSALLATVATGCSGTGTTLLAVSPATAQNLDAGQSIAITASVVNDTLTQGATMSLTGPGTLGAQTVTKLGETTLVTQTYTAPASVTAGATASIQIHDNAPPQATGTVTLNLFSALAITTTSLPNAMVTTPYSTTIATTGGTGSNTFAVASGTLPTGLALNTSTGVISGTPTAYGTSTFSISIVDTSSSHLPVTQSYTLAVLAPTPVITTGSLPNAVAGATYSQQLTYTGGNGSAPTFALTGSLPAGLTLSTSGLISGTPTNSAAGATNSFSVTVTVGTQVSAAQSLSITVPALPVVTTTSLPAGNVGTAYSKQLTYTGGSGSSATWAISSGSLPAGSGLALSPGGLISGTPTAATTYSFSVTVTVGSQTSAPQALTLQINSIIITSSASARGEVNLPFSFQLTGAGGRPPYTWSLAPGSNPLPGGLALSSTGLISGTPMTATGSPFGGIIVQATDTQSMTATQTMTFTISPARSSVNNAELSGSYAFLLSGFDNSGNPQAAGGSFTADGNGHITSGVTDLNGTGLAAATSQTLTGGTFAVGSDNRGVLTLTTATGTATFVLAVNTVTAGVANGGYLSEFDGTGQTLTGVLALQTPSAFTTSAITGGFAFGTGGFAINSTSAALVHRSMAGEIQFNGTATPASAEYLSSSASTPTPNVPTLLAFSTGTNGRGQLSFRSATGGNTLHFTAYVVNASRLFLISADPAQGASAGYNDLLSGQALVQTGTTFNAASLSGTSVTRYTSVTTNSAGAQIADPVIGLYTFNGSGAISLSADENAGGVAKTDSLGGTYTVAPNGRVTAALAAGLGGCENCVGGGNLFFYLVGNNQGFLMDFTAGAKSGSFDPQTAILTNAGFTGPYTLGALSPAVPTGTDVAGVLTSTGAGTAAGTTDQNAAPTLTPDQPLTATYTVAASGRTAATPTPGNTSVLYLVSPTKALLLDLSTGSPVIVELTHQ